MKIVVSTCDKYDYLLPGFAHCFNKYWPGQIVDVAGYRTPPTLPPNFRFNSMNPVEDKPFTHYLHKYIAELTDSHLVFLFDDYWLYSVIDPIQLSMMEREVTVCGVEKADLSTNTQYFTHNVYKSPEHHYVKMFEARQDAQYRASTQPAIWKRSHFLALLNPTGKTPWEFEIDNPEANNNGARIVGLETQTYKYANVVHKGEADYYAIQALTLDTKEELKHLGYENILEAKLNFNQFTYANYLRLKGQEPKNLSLL